MYFNLLYIKMYVPKKYIPLQLTNTDYTKQKQNILKSRKMYKKGKYYIRPNVKSFTSKPSKHVKTAKKMYNVNSMKPSRKLAIKTGCSKKTLNAIVDKGRAAYYSGGSRPNQTPDSWGHARLASAITGGNSSIVDYHLLQSGCKANSKALNLATKTCRKKNKCRKNKTKKGK
jgi:hypothetical protein